MTFKQLQVLLSAGVFSCALISGTVYADDMDTKATPKATASADIPAADSAKAADPKTPDSDTSATAGTTKGAVSKKNAADNGCSGAGGCGTSSGSSAKTSN